MGPNQVRIMDQMASLLSVRPQVSFIKTGTYEGIGQRQETIKGTVLSQFVIIPKFYGLSKKTFGSMVF